MKIRNLISILILIAGIAPANAQELFQKRVDYGWSSVSNAVIQLSDDGYVVGGFSYATNDSIESRVIPILSKFDSRGNVVWIKSVWTLGQISSLAVAPDSGFVATGSVFTGTSYKVLISKFDNDGNAIWSFTVGGALESDGYSIVPTTDSGYIIGGLSLEPAGAYVIKVDRNGNVKWLESVRTSITSSDAQGFGIVESSDGSYIIAANANVQGKGGIDITKLSPLGAVLWQRLVTVKQFVQGFGLTKTSDGGVVVCGQTQDFTKGNIDCYMAKLDKDGVFLWGTGIDCLGNETPNAIVEDKGGDLIVLGSMTVTMRPKDVIVPVTDSLLLIRLSAEGALRSVRLLALPKASSEGHALLQLADSTFVVAGTTSREHPNRNALLLAKLSKDLNTCNSRNILCITHTGGQIVDTGFSLLSGGQQTVLQYPNPSDTSFSEMDLCTSATVESKIDTGNSDCIVVPNPASNATPFRIYTKNMSPGRYDIHLLDLLGNILVRRSQLLSTENQEIVFDPLSIPEGMYILEFRKDDASQVCYRTKVVLAK